MKDIIKFCDMTIAESKLAIEGKLKASMEREKFSEIDKTVKENKEATKCLLQQRNFKKFNHLKHTPKPDSYISNQENKVSARKPKISYTKVLMRNSAPPQNKRSLNIQLRPQTLKEQLKAQHPARQTFKKRNRHNATKIQDHHHEIHRKQTNLIVIKRYHVFKLKLKV